MFEIQVPGKCIIAGEHAVLRGATALLYPYFGKCLELRYSESPAVRFDSEGSAGEVETAFWGVLERGLSLVGHSRKEIEGQFFIANSIPVGAGLGASAALCVAITRFLEWKKWVSEKEVFEFSRQLENIFHGESSGADIAVALAGKPILYTRGQPFQNFEPVGKPCFGISFSGIRGATSDCVSQVKRLFNVDKEFAIHIDGEMKKSSRLAQEGLLSRNPEKQTELLIESFQAALFCFEKWGLVNSEMQYHMRGLTNQGALAVKPTGSGKGGHILSLWPSSDMAEGAESLL